MVTGHGLDRRQQEFMECRRARDLRARETACARFSTLSLMKMCLTCVLTVSGAMERLRAISLLDRPRAIRLRMSPSRTLSGSATAKVDFASM